MFSTSKDGTSTKQLIVESSTLSAMENLTGTDGHSQSNADVQNNSTANDVQLKSETIEHEAATLDSRKSSRVSKITNLSAEEEDALLTADGDTEGNDDEVNEDLLLAESEDDEHDPNIDLSYEMQQTLTLTVPAKRQGAGESNVNPSDIVTSKELDQISNNYPAEAAESIINDLINDLDQSDSGKEAMENIAAADDTCNESSILDPEFSSLHASSSSDSDDATKIDADISIHNASVDIDDEVIVLSSQEQSTHVILCDTNSTFGNASYSAVSQDANDSKVIQSHSQESSTHLTAPNERTTDITAGNNDISQPLGVMQNVGTLATVADAAFENPNESSISTKPSEVCEASAITASTTSDINIATNLSETQFEIENENSCDPNDDRMSDLCGIGAVLLSESNLEVQVEPTSQTVCPDTASNPVDDVGQIECDLSEVNSDAVQSNRTETGAINTSQSIDRSTVLDGLEVNAFLDTLGDTGSFDQREDEILHSNEIDDIAIQHIETIPEIGSLNATVEASEPADITEKQDTGKITFDMHAAFLMEFGIHNGNCSKFVIVEAEIIFAVDAIIDEGQEGGDTESEYEDKGDQHIASSTESDAVSTATDVPINDGHRLEQITSEKMANEPNLNYSAADGSHSDEPSTSNIEDIVIANDTNEEQQQHSEEAEIFDCIEVISKGTMVLHFLMLHFRRVSQI